MNRPDTSRAPGEQPAKQEPQYPIYRRVRTGTNDTVPFVRQVRIGRNDPCPCECGRKAKRCERGAELIEKARWA